MIQALKADVLCVVEVENRLVLDRFNRQVQGKFLPAYQHNLLVDGNDERGIDVGLECLNHAGGVFGAGFIHGLAHQLDPAHKISATLRAQHRDAFRHPEEPAADFVDEKELRLFVPVIQMVFLDEREDLGADGSGVGRILYEFAELLDVLQDGFRFGGKAVLLEQKGAVEEVV